MSLFRFWSAESKGDKMAGEGAWAHSQPLAPVASEAATTTRPLKRRRPSIVDTTPPLHTSGSHPPSKRVKTEHFNGLPSPTSASADGDDVEMLPSESTKQTPINEERAREAVEYQFGLEILLKHDELRLINQELAKCQIALEQLRRCHLIPYPVSCPTPEQMLDICSGKGPALPPRSGKGVPRWAPPFGVVEGPYSRHYAKWLIPDPMFDGIEPEVHTSLPEAIRARNVAVEGRTTRNSTDMGVGKRSGRGVGGQKLQSLSSGYPQPKDKQSPCILKRSDGQTVKLVCLDCHRWDFSSTQGFINHCRIAHKRDYKSHEEAAVHCGQPINVDEPSSMASEEKPASGPAPGLVHPLAREDVHQACAALSTRIQASLDLFRSGKHPYCTSIPASAPSKDGPKQPTNFVASSSTPYLSRLMQMKQFNGNLSERVNDAKTVVNFDELLAPDEEDEDDDDMAPSNVSPAANALKLSSGATRSPAVMRVPVRTDTSAVAPASELDSPRAMGSDPLASHQSPVDSLQRDEDELPLYDDDMDVDLSPNTTTSNNAPSLVSDDGEYDDSDDGSASESSETETDSVSDIAEINIDDSDDTPRPIHHRDATGTGVGYKKDEAKHVTFVTPIPSSKVQARRKRNI